MMKILR